MTDAFQDQLALIRELQEIDLSLHSLNIKLENLPNEIADLEAAFTALKRELESAKNDLAETEKAKRLDEVELASSVEHLRTRETRLYAIKTNKEYQAALKEISEGKRINREREDRVLAAMEKIDALTKKITQLTGEFADKEVEYGKKRDELKAEEVKIRLEMEKDAVRRPDLVSKIDKVIARKYEFIRKRHSTATACVISGVCQGCSTKVPPQLFNEMLKREEMKVCPSCQRLIYVADAPADASC